MKLGFPGRPLTPCLLSFFRPTQQASASELRTCYRMTLFSAPDPQLPIQNEPKRRIATWQRALDPNDLPKATKFVIFSDIGEPRDARRPNQRRQTGESLQGPGEYDGIASCYYTAPIDSDAVGRS